MAVNPVQLQKFLGGMDYPCSKTDLMDYARENGADDNILKTIQGLGRDHFDTPADVSEAVGGM